MPSIRSSTNPAGPRPVPHCTTSALSSTAQEIAARDAHPAHLLILIAKDREGSEMFFRTPRTMVLRKLMKSYMERKGLNDLVFYYGERRLGFDSTPQAVSQLILLCLWFWGGRLIWVGIEDWDERW
ncbi:MAG: hypothetical protein M1820_008591 [Bogoriella megaspora]|nr:MAG: hypothetical protein M1820_008591 [Bogoriella megaspora]